MSDDPAISRRHFLAAAAAGAGGLALGGPVMGAVRGAAAQRRPPVALDGAFRQSVASGQPATDGITLWTRVEELDRTSRLQVEIATDEGFGRVVHRQTVMAESSRDYTVHHRVQNARELWHTGQQYYYRFFACKESSPTSGAFRRRALLGRASPCGSASSPARTSRRAISPRTPACSPSQT